MKRSSVIWFIVIGLLITIIGWEVVWAVNTVNQSAQKLREEALAPTELTVVPQGPELFLSPPISRLDQGETLNVDIVLKPAGEKVVGVDLVLKFDPSILAIIDVTANETGTQILPREEAMIPIHNQVDEEAGVITFSALTPPGETISSPTVLGTIIIEAVGPGRTKLSFVHVPGETTDTNIASPNARDVLDRTLGGEYVVVGSNKQ